jgi:uncharacterized glyoxalase superfamily protein PhnB
MYPTVFPALTYDDAQAAVDFLEKAFGAEQHAIYRTEEGGILHAELGFGNGIVMFGARPADEPAIRGAVYIAVPEPDALCERARAAGAEIVREPHDTEYGSRGFSAKDPEGNAWHFGTYQPFSVPETQASASR